MAHVLHENPTRIERERRLKPATSIQPAWPCAGRPCRTRTILRSFIPMGLLDAEECSLVQSSQLLGGSPMVMINIHEAKRSFAPRGCFGPSRLNWPRQNLSLRRSMPTRMKDADFTIPTPTLLAKVVDLLSKVSMAVSGRKHLPFAGECRADGAVIGRLSSRPLVPMRALT